MSVTKPVPVRPALARAWSEYVTAALYAGVPDAEHWRMVTRADGSVWIAVEQRGRRESAPVTRIAPDSKQAIATLTEATQWT